MIPGYALGIRLVGVAHKWAESTPDSLDVATPHRDVRRQVTFHLTQDELDVALVWCWEVCHFNRRVCGPCNGLTYNRNGMVQVNKASISDDALPTIIDYLTN